MLSCSTLTAADIECKLCRETVKKSAVLCEGCGLICHARCAQYAPSPCDLRSSLLYDYRDGYLPPAAPTNAAAAALRRISFSAGNPMSFSVPNLGTTASPAPTPLHVRLGLGNVRLRRGKQSSPQGTTHGGDMMAFMQGSEDGHGSAVDLHLPLGGIGGAPSPSPPPISAGGGGGGNDRRSRFLPEMMRTRTVSPDPLRPRVNRRESSGSAFMSDGHGGNDSLGSSSGSHGIAFTLSDAATRATSVLPSVGTAPSEAPSPSPRPVGKRGAPGDLFRTRSRELGKTDKSRRKSMGQRDSSDGCVVS